MIRGILGAVLVAALAGSTQAAPPTLKMAVIDMEEGAATLFVTPEGRSLLIDTGASVIGVNARDLSTLAVDADAALSTIEWLRREASDAVIVAESGIADPEAVRRARDAGADAVLVGEHLSRATDPGDALERLVAAGREAGRSG